MAPISSSTSGNATTSSKEPLRKNSECDKVPTKLVRENKIPRADYTPRDVYNIPEYAAIFHRHDYEKFRDRLRRIRVAIHQKETNGKSSEEGQEPVPPAPAPAPPVPVPDNEKETTTNNNKKKKKDTLPWRNSECDRILTKLVIENKIPRKYHEPRDVYNMPEYVACFHQHDYKQFRSNSNRIRITCAAEVDRANADSAAVAHDREIHPIRRINQRGAIRWPESEANELLKQDTTDILDGTIKQPTPKVLWHSRPEYQRHTLTDFRAHTYIEKRHRKGSGYWAYKKSQQQK